MTQEEILDYNRRCAEIVGLKRGWWISQEKPLTDDKKQWWDINGKTFLGTKVYYDKDLKFHSDWNWIMEVVEKIYSLNIYYDKYKPFNSSQFTNGEIELTTNKEAVVEAINQFLIWHEQNK